MVAEPWIHKRRRWEYVGEKPVAWTACETYEVTVNTRYRWQDGVNCPNCLKHRPSRYGKKLDKLIELIRRA